MAHRLGKLFSKGHTPWNKGKKGIQPYMNLSGLTGVKKHTEETKKKMSIKALGNKNGKGNFKYGCDEYYRKNARLLLSRDKVRDNLVIHHADGNIKNNSIENLSILTRSEHTKLHWQKGDIRE